MTGLFTYTTTQTLIGRYKGQVEYLHLTVKRKNRFLPFNKDMDNPDEKRGFKVASHDI